jgi:hypothetical protein
MFDCHQFDDGRGRYPGRLTVHVPRGVREAVSIAAAKESISAPEFVRRVLMMAIKEPAPSPSPSPSPPMHPAPAPEGSRP